MAAQKTNTSITSNRDANIMPRPLIKYGKIIAHKMSHSNETKNDEQKGQPQKLQERNSGKHKKLQNRTNEGRRKNVITHQRFHDGKLIYFEMEG